MTNKLNLLWIIGVDKTKILKIYFQVSKIKSNNVYKNI